MCSPSVHFQEPPSFLFVTHLYYSDLIWATKLPARDTPVGFYGAGLSAEHILHSRGFLQPCAFEYHEELNLYPRRTQHINFARYSHLPPPASHQQIQQRRYNNFGEYNKRPRIFRYGAFFKNKPAMTYSPTPTKVQYHRREES